MASTWECPGCKRRVPADLTECRCGVTQAQALQAQPDGGGGGEGRPWELKAWVVFLLLVAALAVVSLLRPWKPEPIAPVLGHVDRPPPTPTKKPVH